VKGPIAQLRGRRARFAGCGPHSRDTSAAEEGEIVRIMTLAEGDKNAERSGRGLPWIEFLRRAFRWSDF
jgi:hypothetical protein